jgi:hypothetical protein
MKLLFRSIVSGLFLALFPFIAYAQMCQSSYGGGLCPKCNAGGRAYQKVGTQCGVCMAFCIHSSHRMSSPTDTAAGTQPVATFVATNSEPALVLRAPESFLYSLVNVNPEAAMVLAVLDIRSKSIDGIPPARGDAGSDRAMTALSVIELVRGRHSEEEQLPLTAPLPSGAAASQATWDLERHGRTGVLRVTHRFLNDKDEVVSKPYPDIVVMLDWVPAKARGGFWIAKSWKELP